MTANAIDKEQWALLSPLLDELLDMTEPGRSQRLSALRTEHGEVVDRLEAMLLQDKALQMQGFLETPAAQAVIETLAQPETGPDLAGQHIGPYVLQRELGQGGMGSVWLARRADGRFEGDVAIKFLKSGLFGSGSAQRFAREGQILGRLSHPHIARLMDAGVHEGTQPYLVLEYVAGQPIDQYCQQHGLDAAARIRLFLDVLAAVAHAHSRLILHRDLKPSNILVTPAGEVKLLDFGIAKLLDDAAQAQDGAAATEITQRAGNAYTPLFAAPEQVQLADVTTATDVYALGVLLYLLLGGRHPTVGATQSQLDHLKAVVEVEPRRLSAVAAESADLALARQARQLKGDLDTILAKALKKKPAERYANAQALADDLNHWLAHEPIAARPDSRLYVLGRFVRRHRLAVAFGSLAVLGLAGLTGISVWQARRAEAAQLQAQARRQQAEDVLSFMLGEFADKLRPIGRLELLDSVGGKALKVLDASGPLSAVDRLQRAKALTVIGEVRVTRRDLDAALEPLRAARAMLNGDPPDASMTADWRKAQGAADFWLGHTLSLKRDFPGALAAWEDYRAVSQRWLDALPKDLDAVVELSYAYTNLGSTALDRGRLKEAQEAFGRSVELKRRALGALPAERRTGPTAELANSLSFQGTALLWQGEFSAALQVFRAALAEIDPVRQSHPADGVWLYREAMLRHWLGATLLAQGQRGPAYAELHAAEGALSALVAQDPANKTWQSNQLVVQLLALEAQGVGQRHDAAVVLSGLRARLEQMEQAGGPALRLRRLPERARWARLHAALPTVGAAEASSALQDTRQRLLDALKAQPGDLNLARALAQTDLAVLAHAVPAEAHQQDCAAVRTDMQQMQDFLRVDLEITKAWVAAQSCPGQERGDNVSTAREWLASRH